MSYAAKSVIWNGIRLADLERRCAMSFEDYAQDGELRTGASGRHIYIDNGSQVLAIAHLDTVEDAWHFVPWETRDKVGGNVTSRRIYCPRLDDRLGAYIITDWFKAHGIVADVLLTEGEELCASTAGDFVTAKDYHWLVQFDRTGTDVVGYNYMDDDWAKALEPFGVKTAHGSVSDICWLYHLGAKGFNWGCAYYDYHTSKAYCHPHETEQMLERFVAFYDTWKDVALPHAYDATRDARASFWSGYRYDEWESEETWAQSVDGTWYKRQNTTAVVDGVAKPIAELDIKALPGPREDGWTEHAGGVWEADDGSLWQYSAKQQDWVQIAAKGASQSARRPEPDTQSENVQAVRSKPGDMLVPLADSKGVGVYSNIEGEIWYGEAKWSDILPLLTSEQGASLMRGNPLLLPVGFVPEDSPVFKDSILVFSAYIHAALESDGSVSLRKDMGSFERVIYKPLADVLYYLVASERESFAAKKFINVDATVFPSGWFESALDK